MKRCENNRFIFLYNFMNINSSQNYNAPLVDTQNMPTVFLGEW